MAQRQVPKLVSALNAHGTARSADTGRMVSTLTALHSGRRYS